MRFAAGNLYTTPQLTGYVLSRTGTQGNNFLFLFSNFDTVL